jgi:hypothetical protein
VASLDGVKLSLSLPMPELSLTRSKVHSKGIVCCDFIEPSTEILVLERRGAIGQGDFAAIKGILYLVYDGAGSLPVAFPTRLKWGDQIRQNPSCSAAIGITQVWILQPTKY